MTIEYIDGFDRANTNASLALRGWQGITGTFAAITGRNSQGSALRLSFNGTNGMWRDLPGGNLASRVVGMALKYRTTSFASSSSLFSLRDGSTAQINVFQGAYEGRLIVKQGTTTLGTSAILWSDPAGLGVWKYVELVSTIHNTTGSYELFVDGVSVLSGTNVDTQGSANAYANRLYIDGSYNGCSDFDDLYVGSTRLGERRVVSLSVTSDSAVAWTRSTGSNNYATVDDNPLSASDYNQATAASLRDQFGLEDLSFTPASIDAVAVNYTHTKTDSGARTIRAGIVSGGSTGNGTTVSPVLSVDTFRQELFATDPNTGSAWTKSGVDAAEPFYETMT